MAILTPQNSPQENHLATRLLALVLILIGIGMVVWVFFSAKQLLEAQSVPLPAPTPAPKPLPGATPAPDNTAGDLVVRGVVAPLASLVRSLLTLLVMCVAGSLVAALGIRWWGKR